MRVRSTVATDDPIHLGSALLIQRQDKLTEDELHQVLLLAEHGTAYATEAALKTRVGV